jgi:hypothetical protein
MAIDQGRNMCTIKHALTFVAYGGVLIFTWYTRDGTHTPIIGDSEIQLEQELAFMDEGCVLVHLVPNLPPTYRFIVILLQKKKKRERVRRMNLAQGFETGRTGLWNLM